MNWIHFLLWVAGIYAAYYLALILLDLTGGRKQPAGRHAAAELTFSETVIPAKLEHSEGNASAKEAKPQAGSTPRPKPEPEVISSGGVRFSELFRLAKQEAIIYTQSVSF